MKLDIFDKTNADAQLVQKMFFKIGVKEYVDYVRKRWNGVPGTSYDIALDIFKRYVPDIESMNLGRLLCAAHQMCEFRMREDETPDEYANRILTAKKIITMVLIEPFSIPERFEDTKGV